MLKFIKSFLMRFSKQEKVKTVTVENNIALPEVNENIKVVNKSSNMQNIRNIYVGRKHKLPKSTVKINTVHIHVNKKEKIIVKFFQKNGLEVRNQEQSGQYSVQLLDNYQKKFSSLGYEIKVYNHLSNINSKHKITISKKSTKIIKKIQLENTSDTYEIGYVMWFDSNRGFGRIKSSKDIEFFVHITQLVGHEILENDIVVFMCDKDEKKRDVAKKVLVLKNNRESLIRFVVFNDKYREKYKSFFTSEAVKTFCKSFLKPTYIYDMPEYSFVNLLHDNNWNSDVMYIVDDYIAKNKTISSSLEKMLITHLNNDAVTYILKSKNLNLFLDNPIIIEKLNTLPSFIKNKYKKWLTSINEAMNYNHENVTFNPSLIYDSFTDADYLLARQWIDKSVSDQNFEYARMISARGAELAASNFYKTLNFNVSDTAMTQINHSSKDWLLFDLLLDNTKCVDVKNSRGVINERLSYSEHCIQKFKKNRNDVDITISGVISPYLKMLKDENKLDSGNLYGSDELENSIIVLGETSYSIINDLSKNLSERKYLVLDRKERSFIPDWLFEYPKEFYIKRELLKESFKNDFKEHLNLNEYKILDINVIPFFLGNGIRLPSDWVVLLSSHQLNFYNRLRRRNSEIITKPFLYLVLLSHFIERLRQNNVNNYSPYDYLKLIYYDDKYEYPLSIYDPTLIIKKLIDTLDELWRYRDQIDLEDYTTFKYTEKGMLKAKKTMESPWNTLLAYCGGRIDGKGPCGCKPLIKGPHETCSTCNHIICPKCNFCKKECKGIGDRKITDEINFNKEYYYD